LVFLELELLAAADCMYGVKVWRQQTTAKISAKYKAAHSEEKGGENECL
jgi:hypothetical protein